LGLAIVGILTAYRIYYMPGFDRSVFARGVPGAFQRALENRWYISKFYDDFAYKVWYGFSIVADMFDRYVIDGIVNGFAYLGANSGNVIRKGQSGDVRRYTSLVVVGIVFLILFLVYIIPWIRGQGDWFGGWF
jgi:NADH-quinone oxidoreductase subunit L